MTKLELEEKVEALNKQLDEMRNAFRNMANQSNIFVEMLAKINEEILNIRTEIMRVKNSIPATPTDVKRVAGISRN